MKREEKRNSILETADRLFGLQGFNGTGVDQIAAESGVTKRTLYKHFGSKEGLITAVLEQHRAEMLERTRAQVAAAELSPRERLLLCFDLYRNWFSQRNFHGCIFIKTLNEFASCSPGLSEIAKQAKRSMRNLIYDIAAEAKLVNPDLLADQLQLLLEGSIVVAQSGSGPEVIDVAKDVAIRLINEAER
ncbi:MAG: TetR/AcrR family transcriptional regulator [Verrucomicrobiota bacterium]